MHPTFFDLAVAMGQQDIERNSVKAQRLAQLPSESYGESIRRWTGAAAGAVKSIFGQKEQPCLDCLPSTGSLA